MQRRSLHDRSGSALLASLIVCVLIAGIAGLYLETVRHELKETHRTRLLLESVNLAEIGAEDALYALLNDDWSNWSSGTYGYSRRIPAASRSWNDPTAIPSGRSGETSWIDVFVSTVDPSRPVIVAEANLEHKLGVNVSRQIRIDLSTGSLFMNGLTARDQVEMNGNKIDVDSYNSDDGPYNATTNRKDNGSVASVSVAVAAVDLQNADVLGYVATGGSAPSVGKNGSVRGFDTPSGTKVDLTRVTTDFFAEFPAVSAPGLSSPSTSLTPSGPGTYHLATDHALSSLTVASGDVVNITSDLTMVIDGSLTIKGEINVNPGATLTLYVSGDVDIGGIGIVNNHVGSKPENVIVYGTGAEGAGQLIKLHGNGAIQVAIYAPYAEVEMKGSGSSGTMYGAVVAESVLLTGNFEFHYDEALKEFDGDEGFSMDRWIELNEAEDRFSDVLALKDEGL